MMSSAEHPSRPPAPGARPLFMWITPGRVFYAGLLGRPSTRRLGGWIVYFADEAPLRLSLGSAPAAAGSWREGMLAIVPPYQPHSVASPGRYLSDMILEPESVNPTVLAGPLGALCRQGGGVFDDRQADAAALRRLLLDAQHRLAAAATPVPADDAVLDAFVFGAAWPRRTLDARIEQALVLLAGEGPAVLSAEDLAAAVQLSFSRFLHLFKQEVGVPLRTFRSWKRARSLLQWVTQAASLTEIALHTGYPDSAHFSRSIRQVFGLQPRDLMAGSRRIVLLSAGKPPA